MQLEILLNKASVLNAKNGSTQALLIALIVGLISSSIFGGPLGVFVRGERQIILIFIATLSVYSLLRDDWSDVMKFVLQNLAVLSPTVFTGIALLWVALPLTIDSSFLRFALADAQSLVVLPLLTFVFIAQRHQLIRLPIILRLTCILCACLALVQVTIWVYLRIDLLPNETIYSLVEMVFETRESVYILQQPSNQGAYLRVVWISSYWLIFAVFLSPSLGFQRSTLFTIQFLCGVAMLVSHTRGIWLGLVIGVFMIAIFAVAPVPLRRRPRRAAPWLIAALALMASVLFVVTIDAAEGRTQTFLARFYSSSSEPSTEVQSDVKDESMVERVEQTKRLLEKWKERPVMGHGFGAYVHDHFSHEERPFLYEMLPAALLMKLGFIGFAMYLTFLLYISMRLWILSRNSEFALALFAGYSGYMVQIHTNPVFFSVTGMLIFSMFLYSWLTVEVIAKQDQMSALGSLKI